MPKTTTQTVVKSKDVEPVKTPTSFKDLNTEQLVAAADYFGADLEGGDDGIRASLLENGVTWKMYVKAFELPGHETIPEAEALEPLQVDLEDAPDAPEGVEEVSEVITTVEVPDLAPREKYLIKFIGENPYFEFGKYKFTVDRPYGIMSSTDAQAALVQEPKKFRQAFPEELAEFYDETKN